MSDPGPMAVIPRFRWVDLPRYPKAALNFPDVGMPLDCTPGRVDLSEPWLRSVQVWLVNPGGDPSRPMLFDTDAGYLQIPGSDTRDVFLMEGMDYAISVDAWVETHDGLHVDAKAWKHPGRPEPSDYTGLRLGVGESGYLRSKDGEHAVVAIPCRGLAYLRRMDLLVRTLRTMVRKYESFAGDLARVAGLAEESARFVEALGASDSFVRTRPGYWQTLRDYRRFVERLVAVADGRLSVDALRFLQQFSNVAGLLWLLMRQRGFEDAFASLDGRGALADEHRQMLTEVGNLLAAVPAGYRIARADADHVGRIDEAPDYGAAFFRRYYRPWIDRGLSALALPKRPRSGVLNAMAGAAPPVIEGTSELLGFAGELIEGYWGTFPRVSEFVSTVDDPLSAMGEAIEAMHAGRFGLLATTAVESKSWRHAMAVRATFRRGEAHNAWQRWKRLAERERILDSAARASEDVASELGRRIIEGEDELAAEWVDATRRSMLDRAAYLDWSEENAAKMEALAKRFERLDAEADRMLMDSLEEETWKGHTAFRVASGVLAVWNLYKTVEAVRGAELESVAGHAEAAAALTSAVGDVFSAAGDIAEAARSAPVWLGRAGALLRHTPSWLTGATAVGNGLSLVGSGISLALWQEEAAAALVRSHSYLAGDEAKMTAFTAIAATGKVLTMMGGALTLGALPPGALVSAIGSGLAFAGELGMEIVASEALGRVQYAELTGVLESELDELARKHGRFGSAACRGPEAGRLLSGASFPISNLDPAMARAFGLVPFAHEDVSPLTAVPGRRVTVAA